MKIAFYIAACAVMLSGCAYNVSMMPRDSGKVYSGEFHNQGRGSGPMTITMDDKTCIGQVVKVASNEGFGFINSYGANNRGLAASSFSAFTTAGDVTLKAILSCSNGSGLRCDITGRGSSGGGVCVDDAGAAYDLIATMK